LYLRRAGNGYQYWSEEDEAGGSWDMTYESLYNDALTDTHLATRGWAIQERLLPPRNLHFNKTDLIWECEELLASSLFPDGIPDGLRHSRRYNNRTSLADQWSDIIWEYSKAKLSKATDKLIALSGLARDMHTRTGSEYVAGMFRYNLETELLWEVFGPPAKRPQVYQAPTVSTFAFADAAVANRTDLSLVVVLALNQHLLFPVGDKTCEECDRDICPGVGYYHVIC
jgi:hypothetical protein